MLDMKVYLYRCIESITYESKLSSNTLKSYHKVGPLAFVGTYSQDGRSYLELALNGPLDLETRDNLSRSHVASKVSLLGSSVSNSICTESFVYH